MRFIMNTGCDRRVRATSGRAHRPKHLSTDATRADDRNFIPADPPGKYEIA